MDEALKGVPVPWAQVPSEIKRLQELRKKKGDDLDLLNEHIAKLTKDVADKRASNARESDRLGKIRTKIARNAKVGAITKVDSTWGFVIINLGTNNSNVTPQSKLLITRNGRLLAGFMTIYLFMYGPRRHGEGIGGGLGVPGPKASAREVLRVRMPPD